MTFPRLHQLLKTMSRSPRPGHRARALRQPAFRPRLELLEDRLSPAALTWTGLGTGSNHWSDAANWVDQSGQVRAPNPTGSGDDLVFPVTASQRTNLNDLPSNASVSSLTFLGSGYNVLSGTFNNIVLLNGIIASNASGSNSFAPGIFLGRDLTLGETITVTTAGAQLSLTGSLSDGLTAFGADLTKLGAGALVLSGANSYGVTTISAGTLRLGAANALPGRSGVSVAAGATLDLNSHSETIGSLDGAGSVTLGSGTLTTGGNNASTTFSGVINGTGGVTKRGTGTFTLSGNNGYTGTTTMTAGNLFIDGSQPNSPVSVTDGGIFGGTGTIGALTATGGTVSPGDGGASTGILTVNGNLALGAGSVFSPDLFNTTPGSGFDQLIVTGTVSVSGCKLLPTGTGGNVDDRFPILSKTSAGTISTRFQDVNGVDLPDLGFLTDDTTLVRYQIFYASGDGNDVVLKHVNTGAKFPNRSVTTPINEGDLATVSGTISDPDVFDTFLLDVNWGDGTPVQTFVFLPGTPRDVQVSHRYLDNPTGAPSGTYTIHLTWRDQHGDGNSGDLAVTVNNVAPTVHAGGDETVHQGATFTRNGFFTDPGILDTWTATVDYGDGSGPQPLALNPGQRFHLRHRYTQPGVYRVIVTVIDDDGGIGTDSFLVTVSW
jgi:autotransporter-associated beta strand protein